MVDDPTPTVPAPAPQGNDPTARGSDGTLLAQPNSTPTPSPTPNDPAPSDPNAPPAPAVPAGAPEAYAAFTPPEGATLDAATLDTATPLFKELGLSQAQAQRAVEWFTKYQQANADVNTKAVEAQREAWRAEGAKDPVLAGKLESVKIEIGRALTHVDAETAAGFKAAMDLTGAGDNPAFIKTFYKLSQLVNEGHHVSGSGPTTQSQARPGTPARPSAAQSMYPHLPN